MTRAMPTPPDGLTVEELAVWQAEHWTPWVEAARRRQGQRASNGRQTGRDRQRVERQERFIDQVAGIDRRTLIASLDEVDPAELLEACDPWQRPELDDETAEQLRRLLFGFDQATGTIFTRD
jgi:hypothetical protein